MFDKPTRKLFLRQHAVRILTNNSVMVYDLLAEFDSANYNTPNPVSFAVHAQAIGGENGGEFILMCTKDNIWTVRKADNESSCVLDELSPIGLIDTVCKALSRELDYSEEDELHESITAYYRAFGEIDNTVQSLMFKGVMLTLKKYLTDLANHSNIKEAYDWSITPTVKHELDKAWERYYNECANTEIA